MPFVSISPGAQALLRALSGPVAERCLQESLLPNLRRGLRTDNNEPESLREAFGDPYRCLQCLFGHYAFSRRGKDRAELGELANQALQRTVRPEAFEQFLRQPDATLLWESYLQVCEERRKKPMEQLNRGVIAGLAELAQEIYRLDGLGSIAEWVVAGIVKTGHIEPQFLRMVDVRGVGPKLTSLFLRDIVFLYGLEERIDHADRLYVQPVDKWIRLLAPHVIDEPEIGEAADWILAGKIAKYCRHAGVSGIRFNMGASFFGGREIREPSLLQAALQTLRA
jgi:hypothetical protein